MTNIAIHPQIESLKQFYTFRGDEAVTAFLEKYPFLTPLLDKAAVACEHYFPGAQLFLEVDIDSVEHIEELLILVAVNLDSENAYNALDNFDREWWIPHLDIAQGKLNIILEFV
jgi:hypothetical protein